MDGDARRPLTPHTPQGAAPDYNVHVDYELPRPGRPNTRKQRDGDNEDGAQQDRAGAETAEHDSGEGEDKPKATPTPRWKKVLFGLIGALVVLLLIVGGTLYWLHSRQYASTDDAFVDGHISQISAQVSGRVVRIAVDDYQHVKAGEVLVEIDPRDLKIKLDQARAQRNQAAAQLLQAEAGLANQQASVDQAKANLRVSQADLMQAQTDFGRYQRVNPGAVSRQSVDTASASLKSAQAKVDAAGQAIAGAEANVAVQRAQIEGARANLKMSDVAVANAELQLTYTTVVAPRDGQVAKRTVELGNVINPGQALLAVVGDERWITANFKETQLGGMQPGQDVTIAVDACPDHGLSGKVLSMQPGSGSVFSALPSENATGNYVKVVQRVPVKIAIDHADAVRCPLTPGMSAVPSVKVR